MNDSLSASGSGVCFDLEAAIRIEPMNKTDHVDKREQ